MRPAYLLLCSAITIVFGGIAESIVASVNVPWSDSLAYDAGGYWTIRVPVEVENKSDAPLEGMHIRVRVSQSDGTAALIGEAVAGLRVAAGNGVELLFELESEHGERKRDGSLVAGDVITFPADVAVSATATAFLYAGNSRAWLPPDTRDYADEGRRSSVYNEWLQVTDQTKRLKKGVRIQVLPAETRTLTVQQNDSSWIPGRGWPYRVPLRVRNFSDRNIREGLFEVNTRRVNNRIGKLLGFDAKPSLLLIDPAQPDRSLSIEGELPESLRSRVNIGPLAQRTIWLYLSPDPHAKRMSPSVEFPVNNAGASLGLDVRAGKIEALEPQSSPLAAWSVNPLVKVFRQDILPPKPIHQINVYAARNSWKSFQIALRSTKTQNVDFQITALRNANGQEIPNPEIYKVGFVPVDVPVWYYRPPVWSDHVRFHPDTPGAYGWCDWWPDPLIPMDNDSSLELQAEATQPIWVDVHVPDNTAPGVYRGHVVIQSDVQDVYLPVEVKVWKLLLPKSRHIPAIYDLRRGPGKSAFGANKPSVEMWYRFLARYNVSPGYINVQPKFTYEDGQVSMDAEAYDEKARFLIEDLHQTLLYAPSLFRSVGWFTSARPIFGLEPFSPEYVKAYRDAWRLYVNHITEKGWRKIFVLYLSDEPRIPLAFNAIARVADIAKEVAPDVPIYVSSWRYIDEIAGHITAWGIGAQGQFPVELIEERKKEGDRFIYTTDGEQCLDTPFPATERLMPWFCFKYGVEAFEFWGSTWWTYNPWKYGWHPFLRSFDHRNPVRYPNGDGYVVYPGDEIGVDGPVPSIRLVALREGVDDYEIFHALDRFAQAGNRDAQIALDQVRSLVTTPHRSGFLPARYLKIPQAISEARVTAGNVLDELL